MVDRSIDYMPMDISRGIRRGRRPEKKSEQNYEIMGKLWGNDPSKTRKGDARDLHGASLTVVGALVMVETPPLPHPIAASQIYK